VSYEHTGIDSAINACGSNLAWWEAWKQEQVAMTQKLMTVVLMSSGKLENEIHQENHMRALLAD
jgi:hypothetical protein